MSSYPSLLAGCLLYFLFPLWLVAGFTDYLCHRRSAIEATSGLPETLLHIAQAVQVGIALFVGLFLEITTLALVVMIGAVLVHTATAFWDVRYTASRRYISPLEQHVHSHLEFIPIMACAIVVVLYWDQAAGLFGAPDSRPSFSLRLKEEPLPGATVGIALGLIVLVQALPLAEECWRACRAVGQKRNVAQADAVRAPR
jgi:hypothetical protein